jgi:hypothetical protein
MESVQGLECRRYELTADVYLARQDRIFDASANVVLGLGAGFLDRFDTLVVLETKAALGGDGCLLISASSAAEKPIFIALNVKAEMGSPIGKTYRIDVYWGLPDHSMEPVLRLCDPSDEAVEISGNLAPGCEPLVVRFSRSVPNTQVVGCGPDRIATMDIVDHRIQLGLYPTG